MGSWWYGHLYWFYYFLHFDLSEIIAFARYLPVTPALPVTSETCPLPLDYSSTVGAFCGISRSPDDIFSPAGTEEATAQLTVPSQNSSDLTQKQWFLTIIIRRVLLIPNAVFGSATAAVSSILAGTGHLVQYTIIVRIYIGFVSNSGFTANKCNLLIILLIRQQYADFVPSV